MSMYVFDLLIFNVWNPFFNIQATLVFNSEKVFQETNEGMDRFSVGMVSTSNRQ